jgi:hypothetical protein
MPYPTSHRPAHELTSPVEHPLGRGSSARTRLGKASNEPDSNWPINPVFKVGATLIGWVAASPPIYCDGLDEPDVGGSEMAGGPAPYGCQLPPPRDCIICIIS